MKKTILGLIVSVLILGTFGFVAAANGNSNTFSGTVEDWCTSGGTGLYCMDPQYANDHLVIKWNKAKNECNAAGGDDEIVCAGAWIDISLNGMSRGGSSTTWHTKMIWVGSKYPHDNPYWLPGGYRSQDYPNYEVVMDQGRTGGTQWRILHIIPTGYRTITGFLFLFPFSLF